MENNKEADSIMETSNTRVYVRITKQIEVKFDPSSNGQRKNG